MVNNLAMLFGVALAILMVTFIQAFILRFSCIVYNVIAGVPDRPSGPTEGGMPETDIIGHPEAMAEDRAAYEKSVHFPGVPEPTFERAMRIIFFASLINMTGSFIILRAIHLVGSATRQGTVRSLSILLCFVPLGILVLGGMIAAMLPTTSGKGMLVSLVFHLLNVLIAAILAAVLFLIAMAFGLNLFQAG